jgi:hypothetical protein
MIEGYKVNAKTDSGNEPRQPGRYKSLPVNNFRVHYRFGRPKLNYYLRAFERCRVQESLACT